MFGCHVEMNRTTVVITPEVANELVRRGLIQCIDIGRFKAITEDDLKIWKILRKVR